MRQPPTPHAVSVRKPWPVALGDGARWQLPPHTAVDEYTPSIQVEMSSVQPKRANSVQPKRCSSLLFARRLHQEASA